MATKSDLAQKLLSDLRLRKERMAASQSSAGPKKTSRDAYCNPGQTYRGSRQTKTVESAGSRTMNSQRRSSGSRRLPNIEESSKQMVPFSRGQSSEKLDLSMGLAFALENGGRLGKMDASVNQSVLGFLHQISRRSLDITKMDRRSSLDKYHPSTCRFPNISLLHIKEISKGVQNLNQILRSCSSGLNFDRYSIEIGKELLKGAMDLEESLRMLVNLQEASDCMIKPQRKNRIRLLEEDEDDEVEDTTYKIGDQKQLDLPRFSFDKPSRNSHGIKQAASYNLKQRFLTLTYTTDVRSLPETTSKLMDHKKSVTSGPASRTPSTLSERKNHLSSSQSKPEKERISNVVAKLMGLEELPERVDSQTKQKEAGSRQKEAVIVKKTNHAGSRITEAKIRNTENLAAPSIDRKIPKALVSPSPERAFLLKAKRSQATPNANSELVGSDGKPQPSNFERADRKDVAPQQKNTSVLIDKQQTKVSPSQHAINLSNQIPESWKTSQEKEEEREQRSTTKVETKETVPRDELQQKQLKKNRTSAEVENILHKKTESKRTILLTEKRNVDRVLLNQRGIQEKPGSHQLNMLHKPGHKEENNQAVRRKQHIAKEKLQTRKVKGSQPESTISSNQTYSLEQLQKKQLDGNHAIPANENCEELMDTMPSEELPDSDRRDNIQNQSSAKVNENMENEKSINSDLNFSERKCQLKKTNRRIPPPVQEKAIHLQATRKNRGYRQVHKSDNAQKEDVEMTKKSGNLVNMPRPSKQWISTLNRLDSSKGSKKLSEKRSTEAEATDITDASMQSTNGAHNQQNGAEQMTTSESNCEQKSQNTIIPQPLISNDSCQTISSDKLIASNIHQAQEPNMEEELKLKSHETSMSHDGDREESIDIGHPQHENKRSSLPEIREPLTGNEKHLMEIFLKNQLFLNTAETLFNLNTPFELLQVSNQFGEDEYSKLVLDCGYEVTKRKGRRQGLLVQPSVKVSISGRKVRSLDDLVKQLYQDFEKLKFYNGNGYDEHDGLDYLHTMIERDVQNKDADLNCMWDIGWDGMMFAFPERDDIIRDLEKHMLNGLLDEATKDLLHLNVSI